MLLVPPYAANWRLQSYVNDLADDSRDSQEDRADVVRAQVLNKAAGLGASRPQRRRSRGDIAGSVVNIDVLYIVHVDVAGYTLDLHFRPAAGSLKLPS